jgi:hypothetical protein
MTNAAVTLIFSTAVKTLFIMAALLVRVDQPLYLIGGK